MIALRLNSDFKLLHSLGVPLSLLAAVAVDHVSSGCPRRREDIIVLQAGLVIAARQPCKAEAMYDYASIGRCAATDASATDWRVCMCIEKKAVGRSWSLRSVVVMPH